MELPFFANFIFLLFSLLLFLCSVNAANILFYHNIASYSHRVTTYPLADALAKRGHNVTFLNAFRPRGPYINPNITEIVPLTLEKTMKEFFDADFDINDRIHKRLPRMVYAFYPNALKACEVLFTSPELQNFLATTESLDLVIMDNNMIDCGVALAYKLGAKHIYFNVNIHVPNEFDWYGFPPESSAIPEHEIEAPQAPMSFFQRVFNTLISIHFRWAQYSFAQASDQLARKYLNVSNMPFLDDLARNASLVFYSSDVISDYPRSHPPSIINVGGIQCHQFAEVQAIPLDEYQTVFEFVEETENNGTLNDGFIYISFGTLVLPSTFPKYVIEKFFGMMRAFPRLRFLWKWDSGKLPEGRIPDNLYISTWFPQRKLLAHPKIRGFIMQGGRPSTVEALCDAVPTVALPVIGDQDFNAKRVNLTGGNILLDWATLTKAQLVDAVKRMAYDSEMKAKLVELQRVLLDKPMAPLETAVWWVDYVLRHNDTSHLRAASFNQWWYERRLIDVYFFLFCVTGLISGALIGLVVVVAKKMKIFSGEANKSKSKGKGRKIKSN